MLGQPESPDAGRRDRLIHCNSTRIRRPSVSRVAACYLLGTIVSRAAQSLISFKCALCYIDAMIRKHLAALAIVLPLIFGPTARAAQASSTAKPAHQLVPPTAAPSSSTSAAPAAPTPSPAGTQTPGASNPAETAVNCQGGSCDAPQPHITIATPAPAPAVWPLQERISWVANLVLVLIAYAGVMIGLSLLRKIERQTHYAEITAQAAADSAKAALLFAQTQVQADRPWIVVAPEPVPGAHDRFNIVATNRGRSPARIVSVVDEIASAGDDSKLPDTPVYKNEPQPPTAANILLPGESMEIKSFSRDEVSSVCESPEQLKLVESWLEKIYLYGNIVYLDLRSSDEKEVHQTTWCCWYIHGRQKSGMVTAGPPAYNRHM